MKNCSLCTCGDWTKDKVLYGKMYHNICESCYDDLVDAGEHRRTLLKPRLDARKKFHSSIEQSNIPRRFKYCSFDDFKDTGNNIVKFIGLRNTKEPVFIWSDQSGNGKTHLAVALLKTMLWRGFNIEYVTAPMLMVILRGSFENSDLNEASVIKKYSNVAALLIDDIGVEKNTEYCMQCWYTIINNRYNDCKPTIFTSNYSLKYLAEKIGNRIASRISSGRIIKITGKDYRLENN